ncbi:hypothetical protein U9M48_001591 [Paspalum notatum var. saurae]|uniref:BTB domain-containing protein n=1 Tax=Paspalum notatum var. saurae TaxID=547442 RepID=A0AAQ3PIE0_PASNO
MMEAHKSELVARAAVVIGIGIVLYSMPRSRAPVVDGGRISVSTIAADMEAGSHELTVSGYSGTKGHGVGNCLRSAPFSVGGHSWCIQYHPDGLDADNAGFISVYVEHAHHGCTGSVIAQVQFHLLDQMGEPVPAYTLTTAKHDFSHDGSSWGFSKYIARVALEGSIVKDDSFRMRFHVTVFKIRAETTAVHFAAAPSADLHRDLGGLLKSELGADVTFMVGGRTFAAHRDVLGAHSPVFKAELFDTMRGKEAADEI